MCYCSCAGYHASRAVVVHTVEPMRPAQNMRNVSLSSLLFNFSASTALLPGQAMPGQYLICKQTLQHAHLSCGLQVICCYSQLACRKTPACNLICNSELSQEKRQIVKYILMIILAFPRRRQGTKQPWRPLCHLPAQVMRGGSGTKGQLGQTCFASTQYNMHRVCLLCLIKAFMLSNIIKE